jgi:hypothetical protein
LDQQGLISDKLHIQNRIYEFFMALMGSEEPTFLSLASHCLDARQQVNAMENESLVISFTMKELEEVLMATKTVTPPGTDGFRVAFLKKIKPIIKNVLLLILNSFAFGTMDVSRLNYFFR